MPLPPAPAYLDSEGPMMEAEGPRIPALALRTLTGGDIEVVCDVELPGFSRQERRAGTVWTAAELLAIPLMARRRWIWDEGAITQWCPQRERAPQGARGQVQCMIMLVTKGDRTLAMMTGHGGRGALLWSKLVTLATELKQEVGRAVPLSSVALKVWGSEAASPFKGDSVIPAWDWSVKGWAREDDVMLAKRHRPMLDGWRAAWDRR